MESRKQCEIPFFHEAPLEKLLGAKLPTKLAIFCHLWHHLKILSKGFKGAARDTAKSVIGCWENAGLKPKKIDHIIADISKWFNLHQVLNEPNLTKKF